MCSEWQAINNHLPTRLKYGRDLRCRSRRKLVLLGLFIWLLEAWQVRREPWWWRRNGPSLISSIRTLLVVICLLLLDIQLGCGLLFSSGLCWGCKCGMNVSTVCDRIFWSLMNQVSSGGGLPPVTRQRSTRNRSSHDSICCEFTTRPCSSVISGTDGGTAHSKTEGK